MGDFKLALDWLLQGPAWVRLCTHRDLLNQPEDDPQVQAERAAVMADPQIQSLLADLAEWPGEALKNHKNAAALLHKLGFLASIGLRQDDPGIAELCKRILDCAAPEGPFQIVVNIPKPFGGSGLDERAWMLCDAPLSIYALQCFGLGGEARVQAALDYLQALVRPNGWPCAAAPQVGKFRGPGSKNDPCPYATLLMLKTLAQEPRRRESEAARIGAETLLSLWEQSRERWPYLFHAGTDFRKLKAPLIWYDILHVVDVLSQFPALHSDARLQEMADLLRAKADPQGRFTPESIWTTWKSWDFAQKREPSAGLTVFTWRALARL